jgi:hypothetical protein
MSGASHQPTPEQLKPMIEKHMATWKWLTGTMAKSLLGILVVLALMAAFLTR